MTDRSLFRCFVFGVPLIAALLALGGLLASPARAQCGTPPRSSCISCHGSEGHAAAMDEWNDVHVRQDLCTSCHGGNASASDPELAHQGLMAQPLDDVYTNCHSCHPDDFVARADRYAAALSVVPGNCVTPTPAAAQGVDANLPPGEFAPSAPAGGASLWAHMLSIGGILSALAFFLVGLRWLDSHRVESRG